MRRAPGAEQPRPAASSRRPYSRGIDSLLTRSSRSREIARQRGSRIGALNRTWGPATSWSALKNAKYPSLLPSDQSQSSCSSCTCLSRPRAIRDTAAQVFRASACGSPSEAPRNTASRMKMVGTTSTSAGTPCASAQVSMPTGCTVPSGARTTSNTWTNNRVTCNDASASRSVAESARWVLQK